MGRDVDVFLSNMDLYLKNNSKFVKNQDNEISQQISQGEYGKDSKEVGSTEEERIASELRGRIAESERNAQEDKRKISRIELEAEVAEEYAKEKGLWLPYSSVFDLGTPHISGNENDNYLNGDEHTIYKVNNLINNKGLVSQTLDNATYHNKIFANAKLEFVGFTGFDGGSVYPIFKQQYITNTTEASPKEIADYMQSLGFEQINPTTFTNGTYTVSDLRPRNVLKDADGDIYVIDSEVEKKRVHNDIRFQIINPIRVEGGKTQIEIDNKYDNINLDHNFENDNTSITRENLKNYECK